LRVEFEELRELNLDSELELTGYTEAQIDGLLTGIDGNGTADKTPKLSTSPVSCLRDIWQLGDHRLICGDSTDPNVLAAVLAGDPVRTVFTDPPYNVKITGGRSKTVFQRNG
jgi:hypothetical protein